MNRMIHRLPSPLHDLFDMPPATCTPPSIASGSRCGEDPGRVSMDGGAKASWSALAMDFETK